MFVCLIKNEKMFKITHVTNKADSVMFKGTLTKLPIQTQTPHN